MPAPFVHKTMQEEGFDPNAWMTMAAAAAELGTSRYLVQKRAALNEFELHHVRETGVILVSRASVADAKAREQKAQPKKKRR